MTTIMTEPSNEYLNDHCYYWNCQMTSSIIETLKYIFYGRVALLKPSIGYFYNWNYQITTYIIETTKWLLILLERSNDYLYDWSRMCCQKLSSEKIQTERYTNVNWISQLYWNKGIG